MGNPRKADMDQHTRQKVAIYDAYLKRYLKIVSRRFPRINLFDPCAGKGKYGQCSGSALVACENIQAHAQYAPKDGFHLYLNEPDPNNREDLIRFCSFDFVECIEATSAELFIKKHCGFSYQGHRLWFIDPYGYTQVRRESIDSIMSEPGCEVLLFLPLTFIYRFLTKATEDRRLQPIADFLKNYSISSTETMECSSPQAFADLISKKLQTMYGFSWHATMQEGSHFYSLVFISAHLYGLEKFLEARDAILHEKQNTQLTLIPMGEERDLLTLIPAERGLDNCQLYITALKNGFTPAGARACLDRLEKRKLIQIRCAPEVKRRKGSFFLGSKYYTENDRRITISAVQRQGNLL